MVCLNCGLSPRALSAWRIVYWIEPDGSIAGGEVTALVKHGDEFKLQIGDRLLDFARITIIE